MTIHKVLTGFAVLAFIYTAAIAFLDWQYAEHIVPDKRESVTDLNEMESLSLPVQFIETGSSGVINSARLVQAPVAVKMGDVQYPASEQVWIDTDSAKHLYLQRYLQRFDIGFLSTKEQRRTFVIETLQGEHTLADQPVLNVWLVTEQNQVRFQSSISLQDVREDPELRTVLRSAHEPKARAVPALASLLIAVTFLLIGRKTFWRVGYWGACCTLVLFLVPLLAVSPLLSRMDSTFAIPAILLAFMISASICAVISARLRTVKPKLLSTRIIKALIVPTVSLFVGVLAAVLLSGIYTLFVQDVDWANFNQALFGAVAKPAWVLLQSGVGPCLILALASGVFEFMMDKKMAAGALLSDKHTNSS